MHNRHPFSRFCTLILVININLCIVYTLHFYKPLRASSSSIPGAKIEPFELAAQAMFMFRGAGPDMQPTVTGSLQRYAVCVTGTNIVKPKAFKIVTREALKKFFLRIAKPTKYFRQFPQGNFQPHFFNAIFTPFDLKYLTSALGLKLSKNPTLQ